MNALFTHWAEKQKIFLAYLAYYRSEKKRIGMSLVLSVIQMLTLVPVPLITGRLFDRTLPQGNSTHLFILLGIVTALFIGNSLIVLLSRHITLSVSKEITYAIRKELVARLLFFGRYFYATEDLDAVHSRIVNDTERVDKMTNSLLAQAFPSALIILSLSGLLVYLNPLLFLAMMIVLPLLYVIGRSVGKRVREHIKVFHRDFSEFSKGTSFILKFNELIALSTAEEKELQRYDDRIRSVQRSSRDMAWLSTAYSTVQSNLLIVGGVTVLLVGGLQMAHGATTLGAILSFYVALNLLSSNAKTLIGSVPIFIEGTESLAAIMPLLERPQSGDVSTKPFEGFNRTIAFENVSFNYGSNFELRGVNFVINTGDIIGIFGASGSGKSTLLHLLLGFYTPTEGRILIDDHDMHESNVIDYRRSIGVLSQDPLMFPGTIRENLTYGLSYIDENEMVAVCRLCKIHDFINGLEDGYDSDIGNRSVGISGGQKQRIAIARALLRKPKLIILDEPDNNLDGALSSEILDAIKQLHVTTLIVSHDRRLRDIVEKVVIVEDGGVRMES